MSKRLPYRYFLQDALVVAPSLLGKTLCVKYDSGQIIRSRITEVEAYRGEEDLACHASKGRTPRTETMYLAGGHLYLYLIYGMYWMLNIVSGPKNDPQAILIRAVEDVSGPGRLTRFFNLGKDFNQEKVYRSKRIWLEENDSLPYETTPRIGIDYAGPVWGTIPWRFVSKLHKAK